VVTLAADLGDAVAAADLGGVAQPGAVGVDGVIEDESFDVAAGAGDLDDGLVVLVSLCWRRVRASSR